MESLGARIERQRAALRGRGVADREAAVVFSPYRVCPIGAHSDHQHGPVLGIGISAGTLLAFAPAAGPTVSVTSEDFAGEARFELPGPPPPGEGWGRYLAAAAWALRGRLPARPRGLTGVVHGVLPEGGLSSSASVLVAYLLALAEVNELALGPEELVELARHAENAYVGVSSGILDPASVVGARRDQLLFIDTRTPRWEPVGLGPGAPAHRILVAFTGVARNLAGTGFNARVEECRSAARLVAERAGIAGVEVLGDLSDETLEAHLGELPRAEAGRARHLLGERRRVLAGAEAWRRGELVRFGELMSESCRSSVENYETGSPEQASLQRILLETPGVLGARFSGGGFGGCSVALVAADAAREACDRVARGFATAHPELAARSRAFLVESEDGARRV